MASIELISKAKLYGRGLKAVFGIEPEYDIQEKTVSVFYTPDNLKKVQERFEAMTKKQSNIKVQWLPIITPHIIKNYAPYLILAMFTAYVFGKIK